MKNPASDVSRLPFPSPVDVIWNEFCSWMVSQTLQETSEMTQETDFRLLPALLEHFWGKDFPCPAPFLQALTGALMQHGPFQRQRKEDPRLRKRLFSALLRLDAGRGLVLPFVEACLPHENDPEVLAGLIQSWPPGLVCPETIRQQWCEKTRPPVNAGEDDKDQQKLRQLAWQALFQLPAPETDRTGSPRWLSFLRQQLKFETSPLVLESIWDSLNQLGMWQTSAEERTAWLAELERHSPCGSKASDRFVTRDALLREAIIWRVLFGMHVPAAETDASVLSRELLSRYLSDYLKTPSYLPYGNEDDFSLILLLKTMAMLPAMEHDRRAWLATWEETRAMMTEVSYVSRKAFWEMMVRAQEAGLYPAEETMEAAIRALGSETYFYVFSTAAHWVPPAGRLQKLWSDLWERCQFTVCKVPDPSEGEWMQKTSSFTGNISDPSWWEQQAKDMISQATGYNYWWRITDDPEGEDCLKSFQWICEQSPARGRGLLPGWNTLRPMLEELSVSPEVELFFFSLVRKWGSPEGWQAWWEMAAAIEKNHDHFVIPGGCSGMIRRLYLVETLAAGTASCGEQADETTLWRLLRHLKQQWWQAEDVKLWQWLGELVEKAVAAGEGPGLRQTGSAVLSDGIWPLGSGLPAWEFRSTSGT
jgi:hypothetical protein